MSKLRKISNITETKGPGYENSYGQVTPYHILFKDFGNEIAALPKDHAVDFVVNKLHALNEQHGDDPEYAKLHDDEIKNLKDELLDSQYNSGMDILFAIKDKLLEAEGAEAPQEEAPQEEAPAEQPIEEAPQEPVQPEPAPEAPSTEEPKQASNTQKRLIKKSV